MADKPTPSIQEILAAARKSDGGADDAAESTSASPTAESAPAAAEPAAPTKQASEMSVAEMTAAARAEKGGGSPQPDATAASEKKTAPAAPKKDAKQMSVQEMLAAARGEKSEGTAEAKPKPATSVAKPKDTAAKASPKPAPKVKSTGPMDTSSILAAARSTTKPGPLSKAEAAAAAKTKPSAPAKEKKVAPPMPAKPEYAKAVAQAKPKRDDDRRDFLTIMLGSFLAVGFVSLTMTGGLMGLGVARFFFPNLLIEPPNRFRVGFPGDFSPDTVATKFKAQFGVWIVNTDYEGQPQIFAIRSVCTHLGCTPNWLEAEQKFKCPCHGSGFYKDGVNFEGPAPRPLERYAINLSDDGQLEVDKSKTFQEQLGQWTDSASFVPV